MPQTLERLEAISAPKKAARKRLSRSELQARARTVVLGTVALFILAQVGLRGVIDVTRPELRDPTFEIKYRRYADLKSQVSPGPASVLFMGSSMTVFGANTAAVDAPAAQSAWPAGGGVQSGRRGVGAVYAIAIPEALASARRQARFRRSGAIGLRFQP